MKPNGSSKKMKGGGMRPERPTIRRKSKRLTHDADVPISTSADESSSSSAKRLPITSAGSRVESPDASRSSMNVVFTPAVRPRLTSLDPPTFARSYSSVTTLSN